MGDEYSFPIQLQGTAVWQNAALEGFAEIGAEMKIVIALDEDQFGAAFTLQAQFFKQRYEGCEHRMLVTDPELEDVAEHDQVSYGTPLLP